MIQRAWVASPGIGGLCNLGWFKSVLAPKRIHKPTNKQRENQL